MHQRRNAALAFAFATMAFALARPAFAQPNYPAVVREHLAAARKPPCKVCHANGVTGFGTVTTPFGVEMIGKGARAFNEDSVRNALDTLTLYPTDSSHLRDMKPNDIEVLRRGGDPNDASPIYLIEEPPYGCGGASFGGARSSTSGMGSNVTLTIFALLAAVVVARRRARACADPVSVEPSASVSCKAGAH